MTRPRQHRDAKAHRIGRWTSDLHCLMDTEIVSADWWRRDPEEVLVTVRERFAAAV